MPMPLNREAVLRIIVAIHFVYTSLVLMVAWLPSSYLMNQMAIIFLGLLAIVQRDSALHVELLMVINCCSILFDVIAIGMYFRVARLTVYYSYFAFSAFFAIFLVILKIPMLLLLNKIRQERLGGEESPTFGQWGANAGHVPGYQPVDDQQPPPKMNV